MVGLKSIWALLFSLILFGACVPQKKQTECGSNEAFNSQLRSCVPIVQGPTAFINISSYAPLYTATRYKHDTTPVTFTISVSNPYNQSYTIEWDINYNGVVDTIAGNVTTTSIIPALYSTQIGSNVITAKIISGGTVVDSHNFEVVIQESPKPNINTATITPADYNPVLYPDNTGYAFYFTERNNGATSISNYRVKWTLTQNGVGLPAYSETDTFTNTATNGTNVFYYGDSTTPTFDPSTLGVGSYVLRTRIENISTVPAEVVAEHQWNITVRDPDFGFVSSAGSPLPSQDTVAFFGIDYDTYPMANITGTTSRFCVTVSDPDGSYTNGSASDPTNLDLVVRFYKDGSGTPLYEGRTDGSSTPVVDTVCFDDSSDAEEATLVYNDGSPTTPHYRSLKARVFDEQTGREICGTGLSTCPVTYPIVWNVLVKPLDTGVVAAFNPAIAGDNITYTTSGTYTRSATVTQSDSVTVRFVPSDGIVAYEGYDMTDDTFAPHFSYDIVVKQAGTTVATIPCKTTGQLFPLTTTPQQSCTFTWPAFNTTTNEHLDPGSYVAYLQVTDDGSPVPGSIGTVSNAFTINATVTEPVNPPRFNPAPDFLDAPGTGTILSANEGETIRFRVRVEEDEHDDYVLDVGYCALDATCASPVTIGGDSRSYNDSPMYGENTFVTYAIPDDVLGTTASGTIYFKVTLTDAPTNSAKASSSTTIMSLTVNNANSLPAFDVSKVTPAMPGTYEVFAGYEFTGQLNDAITDASGAAEDPSAYQWFIGTGNDLNDPSLWTAIEGATQSTLKWTPGPELTATSYIAVCYSDGYPRTTASAATAPDLDGDPNQLCELLWTITPKTNSSELTTLASANGEVAIHHVPGENIAYVAYASDNEITVEKVEYQADGTISRPMAAVTFDALSSGTADDLKNLSITASDSSLYIAYLADATGVPGTAYRAHIRKINISNIAGQGGEKTATAFSNSTGMKRKFGFNYSALGVSPTCAGGNCVYAAGATRTVTFNGATLTAGSDNIIINGVQIDSQTQALRTTTEICSDCSANQQASSLAEAINTSPNTGLQGLTAIAAAGVVTIYGLETDGTEVYSSTQAMTAAGKILYNPTNDMWYLPVSNADYPAGQNKIQFLRGDDDDLSSVIDTDVENSLATVSTLDNAWSTDGNYDMYVSYITLVGSIPRVSRFTEGADAYAHVSTTALTISAGVDQIQIAPPIGTENPNVFVSARDTAGSWWVSRLPAALGSQVTYKIESYGVDATDTAILDPGNVSAVYVVPAKAATVGGTTTEGRVVVVSDSSGAASNYTSYLFRWSTVSGSPVFDATTTFDRDGEETSVSSKLAASAPTSITFGDVSAVAGSNTNNTMPVVRLRIDGEVEVNFLNSDVESINSTTNATGLDAGEFRAPYIK